MRSGGEPLKFMVWWVHVMRIGLIISFIIALMSRSKDKIKIKSRNPSPVSTRSKQIHLFPRITVGIDNSHPMNSRVYKNESYLDNYRDPKPKRLYEYPPQRQSTDGSVVTVQKDNSYGKSRVPSPNKDFVYYPIHSSINKGYAYQRELDRIVKRYRKATQPDQYVQPYYNSIQQNLLECDKLISKLHDRNAYRFPTSLSRKTPMRFYQNRDFTPYVQSRKKEMFEEPQNYFNYKRNGYEDYSKRSQSSELPEPFPEERVKSESIPTRSAKIHPISLERYSNISVKLGEKEVEKETESILDLRRLRVNEIISSKRERVQDPVERNRGRIKQRGEGMFNKILRIKEKPTGTQVVYESSMGRSE